MSNVEALARARGAGDEARPPPPITSFSDGSTLAPFRPIQYLGNKSRLASDIAAIISDVVPAGTRVGDLFSGTSVVGRTLRHRNPITAVDIQAFAGVLGRAMLLGTPKDVECAFGTKFHRDFEVAVASLASRFSSLIDFELTAISRASDGDIGALASLMEDGSIAAFRQGHKLVDKRLRKALSQTSKALGDATEEATTAYYFGGVYFSYAQAIRLDGITAAIRKAPKSARHVLTAALLGACSEIVNTVGKQFAQPMRILKDDGKVQGLLVSRTLRDRNYDVFAIFLRQLTRWRNALDKQLHDHMVIEQDVNEFLREDKDCDAFYADPPYTIDHYSRFYHVLETIVLRDNPQLAEMRKAGHLQVMRGIYRRDRHQSPFSVPSLAPSAFDELFAYAAKRQRPLLISYAGHEEAARERPRLLSLPTLLSLAGGHFARVDLIRPSFEGHRRLNASNVNNSVKRNTELLVLCRGR